MKSYNEVAHDVFRRRDEYERKQHQWEVIYRRVSAAMSAIAIVVMLLFTVGTGYVLAARLGIIDDFLGIFRSRTDAPLSTNQQQFLADSVAEIGESISCNGYTVTAQGAFTDGTVAFVLVDVEAPEGVAIDGLGIGFDTGAKEIIRGDNPEKLLNITGLSIAYIPVDDNDNKDNTASVLIQISCVRLNGSTYSFADGYSRYLELEDIHYYGDEYPYARTTISEGSWNFEIVFHEVQEGEVELLTAPIRMQIQRITVTDYVDATVHSIRLKGMGVMCYYTIDSDDIQEPGDFGDVQIVMKDGRIVNAYSKTATSVENGAPGKTTFCCNYIAQAPIIFEEVDHIVIGEDTVIPMPQDHSEE